MLALSVRTLQRWRPGGQIKADGRPAAVGQPANQLSPAERHRVIELANQPEFRSLPPRQRVPTLADQGNYLVAESSFYPILRQAGQLKHRGKARPTPAKAPTAHRASGPNQVWPWELTYLATSVRGGFFYLYLILDIYRRKIVGWEVWETESAEHAASVIHKACLREATVGQPLVLHADKGAPMKGATLLAT
jgi:transposase InsO family protein